VSRRDRREAQRAFGKLARQRQRLFELGPGGAPSRPIAVASASVIEVQAKSTPCPICGSEQRVEAHDAARHQGQSLRSVSLCCVQCGSSRVLYFHIVAPS
jgi:hypothetical protein